MRKSLEIIEVLLVEDNPGDARLIQEKLAGDVPVNFHLSVAGRLSAGLERLASNSIDVLVLDLGLPDSEGIATLKKVQEREPDIPVVVLTGIADAATGLEAVRAGAQDYLIKGRVDTDMIARSLRYAIARKRAERALQAALKKAEDEKTKSEAIIEAIGDGISIQGTDFIILYQNHVHKNLLGDHVGDSCYKAYGMREQVCGECPISTAFKDKAVRTMEKTVQVATGMKYLEITVSPLRDSGGKIIAGVEVVRDITGRKELEEKLRVISITDELTGLLNRRGFFTLAHQQLRIAERTKNNMFLLYADLDRFKEINDTHGHQEGDAALIDAAAILRNTFRTSDIIARIGGDEFAVLFIEDAEFHHKIVTRRLRDNLDLYNKQGARPYRLSISMGMAQYHYQAPRALDELMKQADAIMYENKKHNGPEKHPARLI